MIGAGRVDRSGEIPGLRRGRRQLRRGKESCMSETTREAMSLAARYYTDPDYYRGELEWVFLRMWFHAGREAEIPDRGQFLVREVAGESLIVVRGERGEIRAFYNVCRHRGTRLTE